MRKKIFILIILFFIQGVITNIGHPVTSHYITELGISDYMFGIFLATMSLGMMIGAPFWGNLGDRKNRKFIIAIGLFIYGLGQFLFGLFDNQWLLLVVRFISGFGISASMTLITSELILNSNINNRAKNIAYLSAGLTLGSGLGYYLGGLINSNNFFIINLKTNLYHNVFYIQAFLTIMFLVLILVFFKPLPNNTVTDNKKTYFWEGFKEIKYLSKDLIIFLIALALINTAASNVDKFIDPYFNLLNYTTKDIGNYKFIIGIISVVSSIIIVPLITKYNKNRLKLMAILQIISAILVFISFRINNFLFAAYSILLVYTAIKAIFQPVEQAYISSYANDTNMGKITGVRQAFLSVGTIIGQSFGAFLFNKNALWLFNSSVIIFILSVFLIAYSYNSRKKVNI